MTYKSFLISFLIAAALAMVAGGATAQTMKLRTVAPVRAYKPPQVAPRPALKTPRMAPGAVLKTPRVAPGAVLKTPTLGPKVTVAPVQSETPRPGVGITGEHASKPGTSALTGGGLDIDTASGAAIDADGSGGDVPAAKRGGGEEASPSPLEKGSKPAKLEECCN